MHLRSRPLLRLLSDPLGRRPWGLDLDRDGISVLGGGRTFIGFDEIAAAPTVSAGFLSSSVTMPAESGAGVRVGSAPKAAAQDFAIAARIAWQAFHRRKLEAKTGTVEGLLASLRVLDVPECYPSASSIQPILEQVRAFHEQVLKRLNLAALDPAEATQPRPIIRFATEPAQVRAEAIDRFVAAELARWEDFFDTVESKPLTPEQRLSVVVDEEATLVLAGAGSGKTSVITAKAAYLIKAGIRQPEELLLLAFARDAAKEMSERIEARCGLSVEARTFHALAYDIIGTVEGKKPALAAHASDDFAFLALIQEILRDLVRAATDVAHIIIGWFAHVFDDPRSDWDFKTKHEWYSEVEKLDRRTLQGETVASFEELLIANWLYRNGISYEYEPAYEVDLPGAGKRVYLPDFRLTESGAYIEHFGVRKRRGRDGRDELVTAPFIDRERYLAEMQWKRQVHAENGTVLIETYSWERSEGHLLESLAKKLAPLAKLKPRPPDQIYDRVVTMGSADSFSSLLGTFLRHFKSGGYSVADCEEKAIRLKMGDRAKAFLTIFDAAFREYQIRLGDRIDFEDMVARATGHVEAGRYRSPYRHILVDEFQDISLGRARLIKALKRQHPDARLFAVGDDWQSIYRFAGSDIHIMRNFGHEFGGTFADTNDVHCTVDLGRTFRSVDKIALSARKFVLRNPAQITKTVVSAGTADRPAIRVVWTRKDSATERLRDVLSQIASGASLGDRKPTVLILGRYRRSDPGVANLQRQYPSLSLTYKTIHSSKGLEADHVVLVGADGGRLGFPSETVDDPLLGLVSPETEPFEHAEERRVMYVAMTRAKHSVTMLASESRPSAFVTELMNDPTYEVAGPGDIAAQTLTCSECGGRLIFMPTQEGHPWYRCEHVQLCGNRLPACPTCDVGLPRHVPSSADLVCSECTTHFQDCPKCHDGWLVERTGRYGRFMSCVRFPECDGKRTVRRSG